MERKRVDTPDVLQPAKKKKIDHINYDDSAECAFLEKLFDPTSVAQQREGYVKSQPYKHSVFGALFEPELLQRVQDEIVRELTFTQKETDIYKARWLHSSHFASWNNATHSLMVYRFIKLGIWPLFHTCRPQNS